MDRLWGSGGPCRCCSTHPRGTTPPARRTRPPRSVSRRHGRGDSAAPRRLRRFRPAPVGHSNRTLNSRSHCRQDSRPLYRREWCTASTDAVTSGRSTTVGRSQCGQRTSSIIPSVPSSAGPIGVAAGRCQLRFRSTPAPRTYRGAVPRRGVLASTEWPTPAAGADLARSVEVSPRRPRDRTRPPAAPSNRR